MLRLNFIFILQTMVIGIVSLVVIVVVILVICPKCIATI